MPGTEDAMRALAVERNVFVFPVYAVFLTCATVESVSVTIQTPPPQADWLSSPQDGAVVGSVR